jgi:hypothetical protein
VAVTDELTRVPVASIEKWEDGPDGSLYVYGRCTTPEIDTDQQIVDSDWSGKALGEYLQTAPTLRVQHNAQRDPAGSAVKVEVNRDGDGAHWLKGVVDEPVAQRLVRKGHLRAFSVGISAPTIERDMKGKARGGIIKGGRIVEVSLVDSPANRSCFLELAKSADDGTCEFTGKMVADDDVIAKFAEADLVKDGGRPADMTFTMPQEDMSLTFTPGDLAKILKNKIIDQHYDELALKALYDAETEVYKRNVSTAERRSLASEGHALSDGSYPIANAGDLGNAAHLAATGHGNAEGAKRLIARRAKELGVANPLDDTEKGTPGVTDAQPEVIKDMAKEAEPEITKDPEAQETAESGNKAKKPKKKMPPWMQDDDKGDDDSPSDCKMDHAHTEKCHVDPKSASGAKDAADMKPAPVGELVESPMPAGRKYEEAAILRFKSLGMDSDMGRLHDLTCPAFDPEDVFKYHPLADFRSLVDEGVWQRLALDAAAGKPLSEAFAVQKAWQAAVILKSADMAELNDYRKEMHKAFRDANPGPTSYPSPGSISPGGFCRPVITAGHAANSPGYDSPNSSPSVASGPVGGAGQFDRPPLSAGHQSPSPSHMKTDFEYPGTTGVPVHLDYAVMEKERARMALSTLHDHLSHQFPMACPMLAQDPHAQPENRPLPAIEGIGKAVEPAQAEAAVTKSPDLPQDVLDSIEKGMRKKLGKKVLAGAMTVDEARAKMGRRRAQKTADYLSDMVEKGIMTIDEARAKIGLGPWNQGDVAKNAEPEVIKSEVVTLTQEPLVSPDLIKSAVAEAIAPLVAKVEEQQKIISEHEERWEAAANLPDPNTASWAGLAMNPIMKNARPAGVTTIAENAERAQVARRRLLEETVRTSENAYEREAARAEIFRKFAE